MLMQCLETAFGFAGVLTVSGTDKISCKEKTLKLNMPEYGTPQSSVLHDTVFSVKF